MKKYKDIREEKNDSTLRKASLEDAFCLFSWKNDKETLLNSKNSQPILWENHIVWLEESLKRKDRHLWIYEKEGEKIGCIRLDILESEKKKEISLSVAEISYTVAPDFRGKGYGKVLLQLVEKEASKLQIDQLYGEVLEYNETSRKIFRRLGYQEAAMKGGYSYRKSINTIFFRVDLNEVISTGHVMRCLSVADAAAEYGIKSIFITADEKPKDLIQRRGYQALILHSSWQELETELVGLEKIISRYGIYKILLDSYYVTAQYLKKLSEKTEVFYLDDLDSFSYPVQNIICYANYYSLLSYGKKEKEEGFYLGTEYMPLRKVFQNRKEKNINREIKSVLLLSGGSDPENMIRRILEQFLEENITLYVICGSLYFDFEKLCLEYENRDDLKLQLKFYQNVENLEIYMEKSDLAISAGGTTLYELAAMGVPTITYSFADNQLRNVEQFFKDGMMNYAGDGRKEPVEYEIKNLYNFYCKNYQIREEQSRKMQQLVDGKGALRIANLLV